MLKAVAGACCCGFQRTLGKEVAIALQRYGAPSSRATPRQAMQVATSHASST